MEETSLALPGGHVINPEQDLLCLWDKQTGETVEEFLLWRTYYEMGPSRSFHALAAQTGRQEDRLRGLAARWFWVERSRAYEAYLKQVSAALYGERVRSEADAVVGASVEILAILTRRIFQKILSETLEEVTADDLINRFHRLSHGLAKVRGRTKGDESQGGRAIHINIIGTPSAAPGPSVPTESVTVEYEDVDLPEIEEVAP